MALIKTGFKVLCPPYQVFIYWADVGHANPARFIMCCREAGEAQGSDVAGCQPSLGLSRRAPVALFQGPETSFALKSPWPSLKF